MQKVLRHLECHRGNRFSCRGFKAKALVISQRQNSSRRKSHHRISNPKLLWYPRDWTVLKGKVAAEFHFTKGGCDIKNHYKITTDILCFNRVHNYFWILWYKGFLLKNLDFSRDFCTAILQLSLRPSNQQFGSMCAWTWDHLTLDEIKSKISSLQREQNSSIWRNVFWWTFVLRQDRTNKSHIPSAPQRK